jgi:FAD/FMN-containing dehydrogenase
MPPRFHALVLALATLPAQAEVYKWVDAKGMVHYSNTPPPQVAGQMQRVEDQMSIMGLDPNVRAAAERRFARQAEEEERDWQIRQAAMQRSSSVARSTAASYTPPRYGSYPYSYPYSTVFYAAAPVRPASPPPSHPHHHGGRR